MDDMSHRERKRVVSKGLRALTAKPGWDPKNRQTHNPLDELRALEDEGNQQRAYTEADSCTACIHERTSTEDDSALCEVHLMEALGL